MGDNDVLIAILGLLALGELSKQTQQSQQATQPSQPSQPSTQPIPQSPEPVIPPPPPPQTVDVWFKIEARPANIGFFTQHGFSIDEPLEGAWFLDNTKVLGIEISEFTKIFRVSMLSGSHKVYYAVNTMPGITWIINIYANGYPIAINRTVDIFTPLEIDIYVLRDGSIWRARGGEGR